MNEQMKDQCSWCSFTQKLLLLARAHISGVSFHACHTYQTEEVNKVKDLQTGMHGLHGRACWRHSPAYSEKWNNKLGTVTSCIDWCGK